MSGPRRLSLRKQHSWSADTQREEAWTKRKDSRRRRSKSVTEEDLDELKACIELGFGFESPETDGGLSETLPALDLYYAVNRQYSDSISKPYNGSESDVSDAGGGSPLNIFLTGDNPQLVKTRLKQWAQVVACSVRQSC